MDSTRAGSSTPSRNRSRWDNGEEEDIPTHPSPKRVPKPKRSKVSNSERSSVPSQPMQQARPRPTQPANRLHSIWVPPRTCHPPIFPARSVFSYQRLNQIEEGSHGVVFRARYTQTGDIVALKKLGLDGEKHGFPITALREINALIAYRHEYSGGGRRGAFDSVSFASSITNLRPSDTRRIYIIMGFIQHDLKSLLTVISNAFLQSEIKTLLLRLLSAVAHCHKNWILHRDLKTSNLSMNNRGQIKVADFGLARRYGDLVCVGGLTQLVVTLWYRYVLNTYDTVRIKAQCCSTGHQKYCSAQLPTPRR